MVKIKYVCNVCGEEYETEKEAKECEGQFPTESFSYVLRKPYRLVNGSFDYCMFIGECIIKHDKCPIVFKYNSEDDDKPDMWMMDTSTDGYYNEIRDRLEENMARARAKEMLKKIIFDMNIINESEF